MYVEPTAAVDTGLLAGMMAFLGAVWLISLIFLILVIVGMWKAFAKAGKPGWAAIIPIYNAIVLLEIIGRPVWWIFLFLIPFVNFVVGIIVMLDVAKAYGKSVLFAIFGLIMFSGIGWMMLGFGSAKYVGAPNQE